MIRSLYALEHQDMGFGVQNLLALQMRLSAKNQKTPERMAQGAYAALDRIGSTPGVQSAAAVWPLPDSDIGWSPTVNFKDRLREPGTEPSVEAAVVTTDYFKTMGIPLRQGRGFDSGDRHASSTVLIVNETFGKRFYPSSYRPLLSSDVSCSWPRVFFRLFISPDSQLLTYIPSAGLCSS